MEDPEYKLKARDQYGEDIELKVSDLYGGDLTLGTVDDDQRPDAKEDTSYVGYYADFEDENGNKTPERNNGMEILIVDINMTNQ